MSLDAWVRKVWLAALGALTIALMVRSWFSDPWNPLLEDTARYGHNGEGTLEIGVVAVVIELAVLHAVLQPWQEDRSPGWKAFALLLLVPWGIFSGLMCMHAGGIFALHFLWIFVVTGVLFGTLVVAGIQALTRRVRS